MTVQLGRWKHDKTGGIYTVIHNAVDSTNCRAGDALVVYVGTHGIVHVRDEDEFNDGRFTYLGPVDATEKPSSLPWPDVKCETCLGPIQLGQLVNKSRSNARLGWIHADSSQCRPEPCRHIFTPQCICSSMSEGDGPHSDCPHDHMVYGCTVDCAGCSASMLQDAKCYKCKKTRTELGEVHPSRSGNSVFELEPSADRSVRIRTAGCPKCKKALGNRPLVSENGVMVHVKCANGVAKNATGHDIRCPNCLGVVRDGWSHVYLEGPVCSEQMLDAPGPPTS